MVDRDPARKIVVIVGGAGGIGRAIAEQYHTHNAIVVLVDFDERRLMMAVEGLPGASSLSADITDEGDIQRVAREIESRFGRIDVLVHAAGLTQVSLGSETSMDVYRKVMEVNYFGVISMTSKLLPMLECARGQIVVLSSICGFAPLIARTGYCASKHALHGYFDTLRWELMPRGVSVLIVCPSFVDTDFARRGLAGDGKRLSFNRSTLGGLIPPEAIARKVYQAAERRRNLLIISWRGKLAYWLTRWVPAWYGSLMARSFQVELARPKS